MSAIASPEFYQLLGVSPDATTEQLDAAFDKSPQTREHRWAWRALRDPFFADVSRYFGASSLDAAGFFDDGSTPESLKHQYSPYPMTTPMHKLVRPHGDSVPLVLVGMGGLSPIHAGHLEMMHAAKTAVQEAGGFVAGGYLAPDHDDYVSTKYAGAAALPSSHRVSLCHAATHDSDYLMVCPWTAFWTRTTVNYTDIILRLQAYLRHHFDERTQVVGVVGGDNAEFAYGCVKNGRMAVVSRVGKEDHVARVKTHPLMQDAIAESRVVFATSKATHHFSSSQVRAGNHDREHEISKKIDHQMMQWNLDWKQVGQSLSSENNGRWYAVRDDVSWATQHWKHLTTDIDVRLESFRRDITIAFERAFANVAWPDACEQINVRLLSVDEQALQMLDILKKPVISLDVVLPAAHSLHLSRRFYPADGQVYSRQLVPRPGYPSLEEQMSLISKGSYTLVDDDIATGFTVNHIAAQLAPKGIAIEGFTSLLQSDKQMIDVVDLRDFLVGTVQSGLVVNYQGKDLRVPYLQPWVDLVHRAKIPPSSAWQFGLDVVEANIAFFDNTLINVDDCDGDMSYLTEDGAMSMYDACRALLLERTRLPYDPR